LAKKKKTLGISDVLDRLKNEFEEIEKSAEGKKGKYGFDVDKIELELAFTVSKKGKGGINLAIVEAGGEYEKQDIQKIKLELEPYKIKDESEPDYKEWKRLGGYDDHKKSRISLKKARRKKISLKKRR